MGASAGCMGGEQRLPYGWRRSWRGLWRGYGTWRLIRAGHDLSLSYGERRCSLCRLLSMRGVDRDEIRDVCRFRSGTRIPQAGESTPAGRREEYRQSCCRRRTVRPARLPPPLIRCVVGERQFEFDASGRHVEYADAAAMRTVRPHMVGPRDACPAVRRERDGFPVNRRDGIRCADDQPCEGIRTWQDDAPACEWR